VPSALLAPHLVFAPVARGIERVGRGLPLVNPLERVERGKELAPAFTGMG